MVNSGFLLGFDSTATITSPNSADARSIRSMCPFVSGSKLPG